MQIKQGVPLTTSVCSLRAFLFEFSCTSISPKSLSLIKIENYLLLFLSYTRAPWPETAIKGLHYKKLKSFESFSNVLQKIFEGICFIVKLETIGHNLIKNEFLHRHISKILLKC